MHCFVMGDGICNGKLIRNRKLFILNQRVWTLECGFMKKGILILILVLMAVCFAPVFVSAENQPVMDTNAKAVGYHYTLYTYLIDNMYSNYDWISIGPSRLNIGWDNPGAYLSILRNGNAYQLLNQNSAGLELAGKVKIVPDGSNNAGYLTSTGNFVIRLS
jgi:hypothetical protein